jgi:uncharacterized protein (DUF2132 family)
LLLIIDHLKSKDNTLAIVSQLIGLNPLPRVDKRAMHMDNKQPDKNLQGITLETILIQLVEQYGWKELGRHIAIKCFTDGPSIKSSLNFLRRTPWARKKVENLYLRSIKRKLDNRI